MDHDVKLRLRQGNAFPLARNAKTTALPAQVKLAAMTIFWMMRGSVKKPLAILLDDGICVMAVELETLVDTGEPPIVFVSYSHNDEDKKWLDKLTPHLEGLDLLGILEVWDDRKIKLGVDWYAKIYEILARTKCAICLISPEFLASSFCQDEEIPYLLQRRQRGDLEIFPILVRDCDWQAHPWIKRWQLAPAEAKPVASHYAQDPDRIFAEIARSVRRFLETGEGHQRPDPPGPAPKTDIDRLPQSDDLLFGRRKELTFLDETWQEGKLNALVLKASGGVGKSTLVRCWAEAMAEDNYRGAERVFAWSFYSQGTRERVTSADEFLSQALIWFGDASGGQGLSAWDRGHRLSQLVRSQRTLLLLDGLEPLQYGPEAKHAFERGKLKDAGLEVLLFELARHNPGLCVITSRKAVTDLADVEIKANVKQVNLDRISNIAGRALLRASHIHGHDAELEAAVAAFGNHAYAVKLLGTYLRQWHEGKIGAAKDIPDIDVSKLEGKHPRRLMRAFSDRFGDSARHNLLAMLGLFDRPAEAGSIAALLAEPAIDGLNEHLCGLSTDAVREQVEALRRLGLVAPVSRHASGELDAHPLLREHFGAWLREQRPAAWRAGHGRLFDYLQTVPTKAQPDTLAEMAPLLQAMHHGCQAARRQEALDDVYWARIVRSEEAYLIKKLGAFGADLAAIAGLFEVPWQTPAASLTADDQAFLLGHVAFQLRALGRLREALAPMQAGLGREVALENWENAAKSACNLAELHLALGEIAAAVAQGETATAHADRSGDPIWRIVGCTAWAHALHQADALDRARALFDEAEAFFTIEYPPFRTLTSVAGFYYCDLMLALAESPQAQAATVRERARQALEIASSNNWLLDIALNHVTLGRAALLLGESKVARAELDQAVVGLRQAGTIHHLPRGLLARAAFHREGGDLAAARRDLDEVTRLARRCGMRLHLCDAHLERARLALAQGEPEKARPAVEAARDLIAATGYHRRDRELAELEAQLA